MGNVSDNANMQSVSFELAENTVAQRDIDLSGGSTIIEEIDGVPSGAVQTVVHALRGELEIPGLSTEFFQDIQTLLASATLVTGDTTELGGLKPGTTLL
jgi:hypothetical protein